MVGEGDVGEQVNVGVEREAQYQAGAGQGTDRRQPLAQQVQVAQPGLQGAGVGEDVRIGVGHHVGRRCKG